MMLALNVLSYGLAWIAQNRSLNTMGMLLVGGFALTTALLGIWLMWRLMKTEPCTRQTEMRQTEK